MVQFEGLGQFMSNDIISKLYFHRVMTERTKTFVLAMEHLNAKLSGKIPLALVEIMKKYRTIKPKIMVKKKVRLDVENNDGTINVFKYD